MKVCKICFSKINECSLYNLFHKDANLCSDCYRKLLTKFHRFKIDGINVIAIYDYDEEFQTLLYQFKGCFDIELGPIFLERFAKELNILFSDYLIVPVPSFENDNIIRGFNHVMVAFSPLKLDFCDLLIKTEHFKQADHTKEERKNIKNVIKLKHHNLLKNRNILLVDDVYTTGATMQHCIHLVEELKPKSISVLVLSKTIYRDTLKKE